MFAFDPNQAKEGSQGGGSYITESGVYVGKIADAKWTTANSGAKAIEFTFEDQQGRKCNYLSIYYQKRDGQVNDVGHKQVQAIMGVVGAQQLNDNGGSVPEFVGKPVSFALERENYYKTDGSEGFRFQIKAAMSANSGQTYAEHADGKPPESRDYWAQRFAQQPQGAPLSRSHPSNHGSMQNQPMNNVSGAQGAQPDDFDDQIPFAPLHGFFGG